jgi:hypothetical protein
LIRSVIAIVLITVCWGGTAAAGVERSDFRFKALIRSGKESKVPVRIALSHQIITETSGDFHDLRIFDDLGAEVPYVIYKQRRPEHLPKSFTWKVVNYEHTDEAQIFFLEKPPRADASVSLRLNTKARDFNKEALVYASRDNAAWNLIARDEIFDFSAHVDLRKTEVRFPVMSDAYLKVILRNNTEPLDHGEKILLQYKDLEFSLEGQKRGEIRIDQFTSQSEKEYPFAPYFDQIIISNPKTFLDNAGNSIVDLGRVNLPMEKVSVKVDNSYYHRTLELWVADLDEEKAFNCISEGIIYSIPGIREKKITLTFGQPQQAYVRLKVINHDNPPLQVEEVNIQWVRRNLYLIPDSGRNYTLYFGGRDIRPPRYELKKLVPNQYGKLMRYSEWKIGAVQENETYTSKPGSLQRGNLEKTLLTLLVIFIACALGFWIFQLMKKVPEGKRR